MREKVTQTLGNTLPPTFIHKDKHMLTRRHIQAYIDIDTKTIGTHI